MPTRTNTHLYSKRDARSKKTRLGPAIRLGRDLQAVLQYQHHHHHSHRKGQSLNSVIKIMQI